MSRKFSVHITKAVEKDIESLKPHQERVVKEILGLEDDPYKGHILHGNMQGLRSLEFSLPGGVCRAIYAVKKEGRVCLLIIAGYHEGLYEKAERRAKGLKRQGIF